MARQNSSGKASLFTSAGSSPPGAGASIVPASKYGHIPNILIRQDRRRQSYNDFIRNAWKDEGLFRRYCRMEKATTEQRIRQVGRQMQNWQQNNKSDLRLRASIPGREFFRLKAMDKYFFSDDANLRSLKRDNPNMHIVV